MGVPDVLGPVRCRRILPFGLSSERSLQGLLQQSPGDVAKHVTMIRAEHLNKDHVLSGEENNRKGTVNMLNNLEAGTPA